MIPESLPPLLRGLGTALILVTSALVVVIERTPDDDAVSRAAMARMRSPLKYACCACNCRATTWRTTSSRTPGSSGWACSAPP
jgi:hypothetical protein